MALYVISFSFLPSLSWNVFSKFLKSHVSALFKKRFIKKFWKRSLIMVTSSSRPIPSSATMSTAALTVFQEWFFRCLLSSFNSCLPLSFVTREFFPWSTCYVMLNAFKSHLSTSRKRNFGRPIGRGALGSSLYRTCFNRRLFSIQHTWPASGGLRGCWLGYNLGPPIFSGPQSLSR